MSAKKNGRGCMKGCGSFFGFIIFIMVAAAIFGGFDRDESPDSNDVPSTTAPAVDLLEAVPTELKQHPYLQMRGVGNCASFEGDMLLTVIFVNEPGLEWSDDEIAQQQTQIDQTVEQITGDAAAYGAALSITTQYKTATATEEFCREAHSGWVNSALASIGLADRFSAQLLLETEYGVDSAPMVFIGRQAFRDFAHSGSSLDGEYVVLSENADSLYHELCHLYGAKDFYYPDEVLELATQYFPDSLMAFSNDGSVDELTAYLIGWSDTLTANAEAFLRDTSYLTEEMLDSAHDVETYTGYVTDYPLYDGSYTGYLAAGLRSGEGTYTKDGYTWEGTWVNNYLNGYGKYTNSNGDVYEGEFVKHVREGYGTYTWATGEIYEGDWVAGEREGYGTMTFANGDIYEGDWVADQREGNGTYTWANGDRYEGEFVAGQREGYGTYTWADGNSRSGTWKNGEFVE